MKTDIGNIDSSMVHTAECPVCRTCHSGPPCPAKTVCASAGADGEGSPVYRPVKAQQPQQREDGSPISTVHTKRGYRNVHKTHGDIRGAAYDLACALRGTKLEDAAIELHDSLCKALVGPVEFPVTDSLAELRLARLQMIANAARDGASLTWIKAVANEGLLDEPLATLSDEIGVSP